MSWSSKEQQEVADFHAAFRLPLATKPAMPAPDRLQFRRALIEEEVGELRDAIEEGSWLEILDALIDILYFTYGTAVEMGVDLQPFFDEVHRANLEKISAGHGEKPNKPELWNPPDLEKIFRQVYGVQPVPGRAQNAMP